jgi:hypothetical protein
MQGGAPNPEAKIGRARKHLAEFEQQLREHANSKPSQVVREREGDEFVFRAKTLRETPVELALIAGDVIHNVRAALDHLAAMIVAKNGGDINGSQFPITEKAKDLSSRITKTMGPASDCAKRFVKLLRPYKRSNGLAFLIHSLDIADKHRLLVPVGMANAHTRLTPNLPGAVGELPFLQLKLGQSQFLADGSEVFRFPATVPESILQINFWFEFRFAVAGQVLEQEALTTAKGAVDYVDRVVQLARRQRLL